MILGFQLDAYNDMAFLVQSSPYSCWSDDIQTIAEGARDSRIAECIQYNLCNVSLIIVEFFFIMRILHQVAQHSHSLGRCT
jgi:hypothetical protein